MRRILVVLMALMLGFGLAGKAGAVPVTVTWGAGSPSTFPTDTLPSFELTLGGFTADRITSITGPGFFHSHDGTTVPVSVMVRLNGSLITVDSLTSNTSTNTALSDLFGPFPLIFPSQGTVTGLQFATTLPGQFHSFTGETIVFDTAPAPPTPGVPEPATLMLLGSGLLGLIAFRRILK